MTSIIQHFKALVIRSHRVLVEWAGMKKGVRTEEGKVPGPNQQTVILAVSALFAPELSISPETSR